jgi:phosphatidylglycerol:prolipoprotein diacylglycerol transferase
MVFPTGGGECRHPSQLYEAGLEGIVLFTLLWGISLRKTPPGTIFWSFLTGYGLCRLIVEFFREPDYHLGYILGPFTMGQLLSAPMIILGAFMVAWGYQKNSRPR